MGEIQLLLERTYGTTGVNFEDFILSRQRSRALSEMAGASAAQISDLGRVFLRIVDGKLRLGIHYDPSVIEALEGNNPACGLNDENIVPFMVFLEELDHAVHAALKFHEGIRDIHSESFVRDLELQAKVDTYLVLQKYCAFFNSPQKLTDADRRWLKACVFDHDNAVFEEPVLAERLCASSRRSSAEPAHHGNPPFSKADLQPETRPHRRRRRPVVSARSAVCRVLENTSGILWPLPLTP